MFRSLICILPYAFLNKNYFYIAFHLLIWYNDNGYIYL